MTLTMALIICFTQTGCLCPYVWRSYHQPRSWQGTWVLFLLAIPFRPSPRFPRPPNRKTWKHYSKGKDLAMVPECQAQTTGL